MGGSAIDLRPFTRRPGCPKCTGTMFEWKYVPTSVHWALMARCPVAFGDEGEHLDLTCMDCSYTIGMKTADA